MAILRHNTKAALGGLLCALWLGSASVTTSAAPACQIHSATMMMPPESTEEFGPIDTFKTRNNTSRVIIHGVEDDDARRIFRRGPVEVLDEAGQKRCDIALTNIEPPSAVANNHYWYVGSHTGSDYRLNVFDLVSCQRVWQSAALTAPAQVQAKRVVLDARSLPVAADCLPDQAGGKNR